MAKLSAGLQEQFCQPSLYAPHRKQHLLYRCRAGTSAATSTAIRTGFCTLSSGRKLQRGRRTSVRKRTWSTNRGGRRRREPRAKGSGTATGLQRRRLSTLNWACWTARANLCRCWTAISLAVPAHRPVGSRGLSARLRASSGVGNLTRWTPAAATAVAAGAAGKT